MSRTRDPRCRKACHTCEPPHHCDNPDKEHGGICHYPVKCGSSLQAMTPAAPGDWAYQNREGREADFLRYLAERREWVSNSELVRKARWGKGTNIWRLRAKLARDGVIEIRTTDPPRGGTRRVEVRVAPAVVRSVLYPTIQLAAQEIAEVTR